MMKLNKRINAKALYRHFSLHVLHPYYRVMILMAVLLLLLLSWSGFLAILDKPVSFVNILNAHSYFPVILLDILILGSPAVIVYFLNEINRKTEAANEKARNLSKELKAISNWPISC